MSNIDISTIIKRKDGNGGKGATGYWFTKDDPNDKTARINSIEIGRIKTFFTDMAKVNVTDLNECLSHPVCIWSKKTTFLNDLRTAGITSQEAYTFILKQKANKKAQVQKDGANDLALIMANLAPNIGPEQLKERFLSMIVEFGHAAVKLVGEMEGKNGRDDQGWINTKPAKAKAIQVIPVEAVLEPSEGEIDIDALRRALEQDNLDLDEQLKALEA
jgi:hypothetical protein